MGNKTVLGHIDCPTCGMAKGMRITHDKNGEPFGYCEAECNQQMRIGGDKRRVQKFIARHPWAGSVPVENPVTVTAPAPGKKEAPENQAKPVPEAPPVTAPKKRTGLDDALSFLGVK